MFQPNNTVSKILHFYLSFHYHKSISGKSTIQNVSTSLFRAVIMILKNIFFFFKFQNRSIICKEETRDKLWLIVGSLNTYNSLKFIDDSLSNTLFITTNTNKSTSDLGDMPRLSFHSILLRLYSLPVVVYNLYKTNGFKIFSILDHIVEANGIYQSCLNILNKGKPLTLIFSNDHLIKNRGLIYAAKFLNIPTIYIQHASVSEAFPPLEFDLNLLEGKDALNKYKSIAPISKKTELIGMPKFDSFIKKRKKRGVIRNIGICSNILDDTSSIQKTISFLLSQDDQWSITYRPHPRYNREIELPTSVILNNSKEVGIFEFLQLQDLIICGNSSTHLEAILLNIPSIKFNMGSEDQIEDYYGYAKNGLIETAKDLKEIKVLIDFYDNEMSDVYPKAKYYNETILTSYDGNSQKLAIKCITKFLNNLGGPKDN